MFDQLDKFGLPIVTIVDTPGAYAGKTAEELGQVRFRLVGTDLRSAIDRKASHEVRADDLITAREDGLFLRFARFGER